MKRADWIARDEVAPVLWSTLWFFVILATVFVVRAMRETVSTIAGLERLPDLWTYTFGFTIVANLGYWWLVQRMPRRRFVSLSLHVCALCLFGFYAWLQNTEGVARETAAYAFYAWYSAFNMCVVSLFWVCMVDDFDEARGRRLFGPITIGGTLGAMAGSGLAATLLPRIGGDGLFVLAAIGCEVALVVFLVRERVVRALGWPGTAGAARALDRPSMWAGLQQVVRHPTLRQFAGLIVIVTAAQTAFYLYQADFVKGALPIENDRTAFYATKDFATQSLTLLFQLCLTTLLLRWRITVALVVLPVLVIVGTGALQVWPSLLVLAIVGVVFDAGRHGLLRPAREVVFTPLGRVEKYQSKTFLDSFLYRGSDVVWANLFGQLAVQWILLATLPCALAWIVIGCVLGERHGRASRAGEALAPTTGQPSGSSKS